jgi:1,4-dihydroxy-6-naphthoate synthase
MTANLSLGISPCPNDTFIFHGLIHGLAPADPGFGLSRLVMADVEELNTLAIEGQLDVVKISMAAVAGVANDYWLLGSGAALGRGCGPLLLARPGLESGGTIARLALPGPHTTAALLAEMAGIGGQRIQMRYDKIMPAVAAGEVDAGVVIHEGRFVYKALGLKLLMDFGQWWEARFGLPLPLGVIAAKRSLGRELAGRVQRAIRASLEHAFADPKAGREFIMANAQELADEVVDSHISTFVTDFSRDMGQEGRGAVLALAEAAFKLAGRQGQVPELFV